MKIANGEVTAATTDDFAYRCPQRVSGMFNEGRRTTRPIGVPGTITIRRAYRRGVRSMVKAAELSAPLYQ